MSLHPNRGNTRRWLVGAALCLPFVAVAGAGRALPTEPLSFPFRIAEKGTSLSFDFSATKKRRFTFYLKMDVRAGVPGDLARLAKLAGETSYSPAGAVTATAIPTPVRLRIARIENGASTEVFSDEIRQASLMASSRTSISLLIGRVELPPADYRVTVESLQDVPELDETPTSFGVFVRR